LKGERKENKLLFKKIGCLWNSAKKDKFGKSFMNGLIDENITLTKRQKIFVFQTDPSKRGPKSPIATIVVGVEDGATYQPKEMPVAPEPVEEPMPDPLPDDTGDAPF
jgi:hypothetical protein